ncbi:hypothetical protein [Hymenobacter terrenus]|uniref:hypothetical protein n=1 Tax=Hymenobacter terrenus TaxID=1629124 RepID=UPI0006191866|nr:hypothetical protein [Hymenobacter terrenus]
MSDILATKRTYSGTTYQTNDFRVRQPRDTRMARLNSSYNFGNGQFKAAENRDVERRKSTG